MKYLAVLALAACASGACAADSSSKLNLQLYGLSYHPDRSGTKRAGLDNEVNLGLGLNYEIYEDARGTGFVEGGFYRDSGRKWAKFGGAGYQFKLGGNWLAGGALVLAQSATYNRGGAFIAPIPIVTYDFGSVKLNAMYVPKYGEYNQFAVFGFYLSVPLPF